jgi:Reverse transcriptase (RNA-dependent DNA polymerase)
LPHCFVELVELLEDLYSKTISAVRVDGELTEWFRVRVGVRQGCGLSPYLFNLILEAMMQVALNNTEIGIRISGELINNLRFADDIDLLAESRNQLQELTNKVYESSRRFGLQINGEKTKTMTIGKKQERLDIKLGTEELEQVEEFIYLGGVITEDAGCAKDMKRRIGLTSAMFGKLRKLWKSKNISKRTKTKLYEALVIPVLLYGAECWCMKKEDERRLLAAEMGWLRGILNRSRRERIRNEVTREELGQKDTIVDKIRRRRLTWYGHVARMDNRRIPPTALHGTVEGVRSRGRQKKTWMDNILEDIKEQEWSIRELVDHARDRPKWKSYVRASSSVNT